MRYRIGEFARLAGTSIKTLRYYDASGLLQPVEVDVRTRYRYYAPEQLQDLAAIRAMKELGAKLQDIGGVVNRADPDGRRRLLKRLHDRAITRLRETSRSLRWLNAALEGDAHDPMPVPVVTKWRGEIRIASIRTQLRSYADIGDVERDLARALRPQDLGPARGVLWHRCEASGAIDGEPFVEIASRAPHSARYGVRHLPASTVASAFCESEDAAAVRTYEAIDRWLHAHELRLAGAKRELYVGRILEIQFPVQPL
jgi:DNA-binding transcriptional MerR regulator